MDEKIHKSTNIIELGCGTMISTQDNKCYMQVRGEWVLISNTEYKQMLDEDYNDGM